MRLADRRPTHPQPFLLVMPTWRQDLRDLLARQPDQESRVRVLEESDFIREWRAFLSSEPVVRLARSGGKVVFLVHPSFDRFADDVKFADHVVVRSLGAVALQELMSECTSFVTDYSSIAFDLAFIGRPVTYFQFDRDAVFAGAHTTRPGYFDYERDGFGPVLFEATGAAEAAVYYCAGAPIDPEYRRRSEVAFPFRDDSNSERVVCAISEVLGAKR